MKKNIGKVDKILRFSIGFLAIVVVLLEAITGVWANILLILGALMLITASVNFCPLYLLFNWTSCKIKDK